jgi:hypothetical protein
MPHGDGGRKAETGAIAGAFPLRTAHLGCNCAQRRGRNLGALIGERALARRGRSVVGGHRLWASLSIES